MAKKVLIADDEPDMADFLKTALEADGALQKGAGMGKISTKVKEVLS